MYNDRLYLSPQEILEKEFKIDARGYRPQEVDKFLDMVIRDYTEYSNIIKKLEKIGHIQINSKTQIITPTQKGEVIFDIINGSMPDNITTQLEKTLSQVEGAGKVKVLINYSQSGEKILAYDMESNINEKDNGKENNSKSEVVYDGNKMPVILKEYMPKVEGVIIVAQGGNIEGVKKQLISGTVALLGIDSHKIEVLKMK